MQICLQVLARMHIHRSWDCSCHKEIVWACPVSALSVVDVNQTVKIESKTLSVNHAIRSSTTLSVNGQVRVVEWRDAKHEHCKNCTGKIMSVDAKFKGKVKVKLGTGQVIDFENPARPTDAERPFDTACYRSKLCHSPKVCQSWKTAVCTGVVSLVCCYNYQKFIHLCRHVYKDLSGSGRPEPVHRRGCPVCCSCNGGPVALHR